MDKVEFWNRRILPWERKRYRESAPFKSSIYHRRKVAAELIGELASEVATILEFGCGSGTLVPHLSGDFDYHGVDFSEAAILNAREKFSGNSRFTFELESLPSHKKMWSADLIVGLGFIDWISTTDLRQLLSLCEAKYIILSFSNKEGGVLKKLYDFYSLFTFDSGYSPLFYHQDELAAILKEFNFHVTKTVLNRGMLFGGIVVAKR